MKTTKTAEQRLLEAIKGVETESKVTKINIPKGEVLKATALKVWPGEGAVDFAKQYVTEMTVEHVAEVSRDLVEGNFEEYGDKKVRCCQYCGYYYRDATKNNSSLTCSDECKTKKDIVLKAYRRKIKDAGKPKRPTYKHLYYATSFRPETAEYPFWTSDFHMFEYDRKHKAYAYGDNFEEVVARGLLNIEMGGKKKSTQTIDYGGDQKAAKFAVKLSEKQRKTTEIVIYKSSSEEIAAGFIERYGADKMAQVRRAAIIWGKGYDAI